MRICKSSQKYYYYWRPIKDLSETHRRPTCQIRDLGVLHLRPSRLWRPIGDRHTCGVQSEFKHIHLKILIFIYFLLFYIFIWKESYEACRYMMGFRLGISVPDVSLISHDQAWVFDQACRSPMGNVDLWWVSNEACRGLRSGRSVSTGSLLGLW